MKRVLTLTAIAALLVTGCDNDTVDNPIPGTDRSIMANFSPVWGNFPFNLNTSYMDAFGNQIEITRFQIYFTDFAPVEDNGVVIGSDLQDAVLFDATGTNVLALGTVEETHIHELGMFIGIDSVRNHNDPMLAPAPLNNAAMHWGWNPTAGYKFAVIEGRVDSDGNGVIDGADDIFQYHLATDPLRTEVVLEPDVDIFPGETFNMKVEIDMQQILTNVDVKNNLDTHTNNEPALAAQLMSNLAAAISVE